MLIGAHVSISGGFDKCLDRIHMLGGNCLMTFASSPRSLATRKISEKEIENYHLKKKQFQLNHHFLHGVYLVNLASESKKYVHASVNSLIFYQQLVAEIGAVGTIIHIGSHKGRGLSDTIDQIVASINFIMDSSPKDTKLIIETAAGQAGTIGADFKELAQIYSRLGDKSKIGFCLDTQHSFASGYDLSQLLTSFDKALGLKHLSVIHLNDSKTEFNSKVDRHQNLGEGHIGLDKLTAFVNDSRLKNIPFILEVPGSGDGPRKEDVDTAKSLFHNVP